MGHGEAHGYAVTHDEAELFRLLKTVKNPLLLVLDCVQDPHNLGACLRTAAAVGVQAVIVPNRRSAPLTETVRRIACGGAENVFFTQITNLARTLRKLKEEGVRVIGADHSAKRSLFEEDLTADLLRWSWGPKAAGSGASPWKPAVPQCRFRCPEASRA